MNLILAIFLIVFESVAEGLKTAGHHVVSEFIEAVYLSVITLVCFAWLNSKFFIKVSFNANYVKLLIGYILLRFAIFDTVWNISAGQSWDYIGSTKVFDNVLGWIKETWGYNIVLFIKAIAGFWGVAWLTSMGNGEIYRNKRHTA